MLLYFPPHFLSLLLKIYMGCIAFIKKLIKNYNRIVRILLKKKKSDKKKKEKEKRPAPFPLWRFKKRFLSSASLNLCPMCWICSSHWLSVHGLFSLPVNVGYPVMHAGCVYFISIKRPGLRFHWHLVASRHSSAERTSYCSDWRRLSA